MSASLTFEEMIAQAREAIAAFERVERRPWTVETSLIELSKQVGDLAKRVLTFERYYLPDRDRHPAYATTIDNIGNELADILYSLIRIALHYGIDLEAAHVQARRDELGYARQAAERFGSHAGPLGGRPSLADASTAVPSGNAKQHYDSLLAEHYVWMAGGRENGVQMAARQLEALGVTPVSQPVAALDLGCGPGFHAQVLARQGYRVTAVDQNRHLLDEMGRFSDPEHVIPCEGDILDSQLYSGSAPFGLVLCMGDTLLHLDTVQDAGRLLRDLACLMAPGAVLAVSMRDYALELRGSDRFLPVRSDADRIMTVCLDYAPDHVLVHDLIYSRSGEGWMLAKGSYRKLRLTEERLMKLLRDAGLSPRPPFLKEGFIYFSASKPET